MADSDAYKLALDEPLLKYVAKQMTDYAMAHGITVEVKQEAPAYGRAKRFRTAPFAICPTPTPRAAFERASQVQPIINSLVVAVSQDDAMLTDALRTTCQVDEFTANVFKVYEAGKHAKVDQYGNAAIFANLIRNDFMLHCDPGQGYKEAAIYNVEINTIASSFGVLSHQICHMHRHVYNSLNRPDVVAAVPENNTRSNLAAAFKAIHTAYLAHRTLALPVSGVVMAMIVQPLETNLCDQRLIEHDLWAEHNIRMIRVTFEEMANQGSLDPATSALLYTLPTGEQVELSTLYFRAGYSPDDLPTDKHWEARTMMEQSQAVKCPNAACHLVGTKKMQQVLGQREKLERYLSPQEVEKVLSTFTTLVSLDPADYADQAGFDAQLEQVYQNPSEWVLKPQREGGGNNYYGQEAIDKLKSLSPQARQGYIVMAMIKPPVVTVTGLSETAEAGSMAATTEFGFYGTHLQVAGEAVLNATAGFLMRTKAASSHETGVAAGFGLLDVPMLV